jgi:hypothetical protein
MAFTMSHATRIPAAAAPAARRAAAAAPRVGVRAHFRITLRTPEGQDTAFE